MDCDIISYYRDRAKEYEKVYCKPERQSDLLHATKILQDTFRNKDVLEIACGTGYWTEKISRTAKTILATDINNSVIDVAKFKTYSPAKVRFQIADIFNLGNISKRESLFGGFIWSHIKLQDLNAFVEITNKFLEDCGTVVFIDNNYVEGNSLPISENDSFGNTYQTRTLENGKMYKVLKNFPSEIFIRELLIDKASKIDFISLQYYWILIYKKAG